MSLQLGRSVLLTTGDSNSQFEHCDGRETAPFARRIEGLGCGVVRNFRSILGIQPLVKSLRSFKMGERDRACVCERERDLRVCKREIHLKERGSWERVRRGSDLALDIDRRGGLDLVH